jgi:hypothetical protein
MGNTLDKQVFEGDKWVMEALPGQGQRVVTILRIEERGLGDLVIYEYPCGSVDADWSGGFKSRAIREVSGQ